VIAVPCAGVQVVVVLVEVWALASPAPDRITDAVTIVKSDFLMGVSSC
jgi:hypothetical protein